MTIKSGLAYNRSSGTFMGIVSDGSEIWNQFETSVDRIVHEAKELAGIDQEPQNANEQTTESVCSSNTGNVLDFLWFENL